MVEDGLTEDLCEYFRHSLVTQSSAVGPRQVPEPEAGLLSRPVSEDPELLFHLTGSLGFLLHISLVTFTVDQQRNTGEEQGGTC